jgi:hypothetical protein
VRFTLATLTLLGALIFPGRAAESQATPDPARWRGFNLLEKFTLRGNAPFREDDFRWIAELGFNFVRLPMDYRCYTEAADWLAFREAALAEIDQAVAWGARYGVQVCLNLHRAPGYCVNPPAEPLDLWTDPAAERAFVAHWEMFARRYRHVPAAQLSFNLLNEPNHNTPEGYLRVHRAALDAIHRISPERLVVIDGNHTGRDPAPEFLGRRNVVLATRGYHPGTLSHFRAGWVRGSEHWPVPTWPPSPLTGHLYGPAKPDLRSALGLEGEFPAGTELALRVALLSSAATVRATADARVVAETRFDPRLAPAEWRPEKSADARWTYHRPATPRRFTVQLAQPARRLAFENVAGDWLLFAALELQLPGGARQTFPAAADWGVRQRTHRIDAHGRLLAPAGAAPDAALREFLQPWRDYTARGGTAFVGEWGAYNRTPHAVTLAWMKNWLELWREAGLGWALWNFRGSFGLLDSNRPDVTYETWRGHQLDRAMLTLLQRYLPPPAR